MKRTSEISDTDLQRYQKECHCAMFSYESDFPFVEDQYSNMFVDIAGPSVDTPDEFGRTCLHVACMDGDNDVMNFHLDRGAFIDYKDHNGMTPLFYSCIYGNYVQTKELLLRGAVATEKDSENRTVLHYACMIGSSFMTSILLTSRDLCDSIDDRDSNGMTALQSAVVTRNMDCVRELFNYGADVDAGYAANTWTPLYYASDHGDVEMVATLLRCGADPNIITFNSWTPLLVACDRGHAEIVRMLLSNGADPKYFNAFGESAIHIAAMRDRTEIVSELLEHGIDASFPNRSGKIPYELALMNDSFEILRMFEVAC